MKMKDSVDILNERIEELEVERDRYREALELIVENYKAMSPWDNKLIIPNLRIANDALEGEK
jgi:predicted ribosome quality control (RQC) complex YloA/Tae2 family protein